MKAMLSLSVLTISLAALASAAPHLEIKRQVSELRDSYDFIIAGGGTSGLTVADRLTEAFPNKTVLVIEYGEIQYAPGVFDPPQTIWGGTGNNAPSWLFNSLPNPAVKNKTALVLAGKVVGGSSAVNGMFFDRPSRFDFEAWSKAGSPEFDGSEDKWDWDGIYPYFRKSVTFTEPPAAVVQQYGYTWDTSVYGGSTPIYSSFPPFLWADHPIVRDAWKEIGIRVRTECAGGDKDGLCWIPISEHPVTARRSHSGLGHYTAVNTTRSNYDLLVKHQVVRVVYPNGDVSSGPPLVEVRSLSNDLPPFTVTATAEVILSAGTFHTPTILQRSGIGPTSFLNTAGIPLVLDLPGVGSNFQDHSGPAIAWNYTLPLNLSPLPSDMLNATFVADAVTGFDEIPARGPHTLAMSNSAIYTSLPNMTSDYAPIISKIRDIVANGSAALYLPPGSDPAQVAGYAHQLSVLADMFENPRAPSLESAFATGTSVRAIQLHPVSRGTVRLNLTDPLQQPILDYRSGTNPVDFDLYLVHLKYLRRMIGTAAMQEYGAIDIGPGAEVQSDEALIEYIKDSLVFSFMHPCCTSAMMPKAKGGVVGPDLRVHGASGLRIVDNSVIPLEPSSHLSALAYAIGEKAADIIIKHWSKPVKCRGSNAKHRK